ncbi:MAG TPA: hypothetical protein EYP62_07825, partial [Kiritimatiellae bacterium]|nr:hypothetical protein [Kiritimatiellia bacterium]
MLKRLTLTATLTGILAAAWAAPVVLRPDRREIPGADEPTAYLCYAHPGATGVVVAGSWDDWNHRHPMAWSNGLWILDVRPLHLPFGRHEFKFIIDGEWEPGENRILYANMRGLLERPPAILVQALVQDSHTIDLVLKHPLPPATIRKLALRVLPDRRVKEWHPLSPPESGFVEGYVMGGNVVTFTLSEKTYGLDLAPTSTVAVAGTFNGWRTAAPGWRLHDPDDDGIWTLTVPRAALPYPAPGRYVQFKFVLDGRRWLPPPPHAPNAQYDGKGNINLTIDPRRRGSNVIRLVTEDPLEISTNYVVAIEGLRARPIYRMTTPGRALDRFVSHKPLGVSLHRDQQATTYRLFSPRATQVWLCIYTSAWFRSRDNPATPIAPAERYPMWKDPADGVWEISLLGLDTGKYYSFNIAGPRGDAESFDPRTPVGDPYALAAAHAHNNTIVLDPHLTNRWFGGWNDADFRRPAPQDLVIYEMHLRDMTIHSSSRVPPLLRGKYAGLLATRGKGTGLDHLKWLGVNTIELLPVAEFSNRETDYDWGYAPVYYFAPEASYALRPLQGSQYYEFKNLINELHREGFAVILDVVFNHVGSPNIFYFIDKKYFFRLTPDFRFLNFSGCGNDLRTEAPMMRRLIIDNVLYWFREFHVDGFRFDLAELVDMQTMLAVRDAARSVDPGIILISEPWSFRGDQRHQLTGTGWSAWNGDFRHVARKFVLGEENRARLKQ